MLSFRAPFDAAPSPPTDAGDGSLVERARGGDREAFRALVEAHKDQVFRLALGLTRRAEDAEDAVQEVFLRAYRGLRTFRGEARVGSWLYRITANVCADARRARAGRPGDDVEAPRQPAGSLELRDGDPVADPERRLGSDELRRDLDRAVRRLSPAERTIFVLRHHQEMSIREVAATLGRAEGTVKNLLFRALRKLRRELAAHRAPGGTAPSEVP